MRKRKEVTHKVKWQENLQECLWLNEKVIDNGQRVLEQVNFDTDILLTEDDLSFMPTQEDLKTYTYWARKEVYDKLWKPYYELRNANKKGKVTVGENVLKLLED